MLHKLKGDVVYCAVRCGGGEGKKKRRNEGDVL